MSCAISAGYDQEARGATPSTQKLSWPPHVGASSHSADDPALARNLRIALAKSPWSFDTF